mgnify:CR=1 FL=1
MFKETEHIFDFDTEIVHQGSYLEQELIRYPESMPIYLTSVFNVEDIDDLYDQYGKKGFIYNRTRNPNRNTLGTIMSYLEGGESSVICSSGMGAIATALLSLLKEGDHILSDKTLYGETFALFDKVLKRYGIENTCIDITDLDEVKKSIKNNTKIIYTETASNPMITVCDIDALAKIAHENDALLLVDNTFMTPYAIRPIEHGADITINSLTKFINGHCDAVCGSITGKSELIEKCLEHQWVLGTCADAFTSYMAARGLRTLSLRMEKAMANAAKLAKALEASPYVVKVNHPSLKSHPQHEIATRMFGDRYGAMMSFVVISDDRGKINDFINRLNIAHYASSLGGIRTTFSVPAHSSHRRVAPEKRKAMGITDSLIRVSVGVENIDDLIADFIGALQAFKD